MRFQDALANARLAIQISLIALSILFILNMGLIIGWHNAQQKITVYIPPQIPSSGLKQKANQIPTATIYSFAFYIWQNINYWPTNGSQDYKTAIEQFSPYLTPKFKNFLIRDYNERLNQGELQNRLRNLQGLNGSSFEIKDVEAVGHDTWLVHLHMRLAEHMNMNGNAVKEIAIDYNLRVVGFDTNSNRNPWGLALDGFEQSPQRQQTYI